MSATVKEINPSVIALVEFMKANPGKSFTFAEMADGAGVARATGFIRGVKAILGDRLIVGEKEVESVKTVGAYGYALNDANYKPSDKSNPSDNSKAVAKFLLDNAGESYTLAELSDALGFKVLSGHISGARAILGKENVVKAEVERPTIEVKTAYTYAE